MDIAVADSVDIISISLSYGPMTCDCSTRTPWLSTRFVWWPTMSSWWLVLEPGPLPATIVNGAPWISMVGGRVIGPEAPYWSRARERQHHPRRGVVGRGAPAPPTPSQPMDTRWFKSWLCSVERMINNINVGKEEYSDLISSTTRRWRHFARWATILGVWLEYHFVVNKIIAGSDSWWGWDASSTNYRYLNDHLLRQFLNNYYFCFLRNNFNYVYKYINILVQN